MPKRKNPNHGGARPGSGRPKTAPGKSIYVRGDIADVLQQVKEAKQENRLLSFLKQNLGVILNKANPIKATARVENTQDKPITLNQDQLIAIEYLNDWFNSDRETATLSGAGGTGKTAAIGHWVKQLGDIGKVIYLAPTHKAKNVLMRSLESSGIESPDVYTVAQSLGKQPIIMESGLEVFVGKDTDRDLLGNVDLVIVDESSMVNGEDYEEINDKAKKVLFMGDKNQLPPVGEAEALAFVGSPDVELFRVMRYSGHILDQCQKLREAAQDNFIHTIEADGKQIIRLNRNDALLTATELFKSREFEQDSTFCRVVAFRNSKVDKNNKFIKPRVYNRDDEYFKGLRLIAAKPVQRKNIITDRWVTFCNNSEEVVITSDPEVVEIDKYLLVDMPEDCQELKSLIGVGKANRFDCLSENGSSFSSIVLDEEAMAKRLELIKLIQGLYREKMAKVYLFALAFLYRWGDELKDIFCSTVHKSQGSTYNNVFIELKDILKPSYSKQSWQSDDRPKLLYTAASRASEIIYLIE